MLLSYTIVDFYFYYNNGVVDMQICTLLTRIQCKVSDTQVTVKACGPLVLYTLKITSSFGGEGCVMKFKISCLLTLQMLHTNLVKIGPVNARSTTDNDGRQPIAIGHLSDSGDLKIKHLCQFRPKPFLDYIFIMSSS